MVYWDLLVGAVLYGIGFAFFAPFEARTPIGRRILKLGSVYGLAVFLSWRFGPAVSLSFILAMFALGLVYHAWWTRKHGITFMRPEPRDKYYRLRGWPLEEPPTKDTSPH